MESYIGDRNARADRYTKRLNGTIKVLIVDGIFIMPNPRRRVCDLVTDRGDAVIYGIRPEFSDR